MKEVYPNGYASAPLNPVGRQKCTQYGTVLDGWRCRAGQALEPRRDEKWSIPVDEDLTDYAATSSFLSSVRSIITPLSNVTPARTSATRCGALTDRHRSWAASSSLKAMASPAALRALAFGHFGPESHGCEGRLDRVGGFQVDPVLGGVVEEAEEDLGVVNDLRRRNGVHTSPEVSQLLRYVSTARTRR